MQIFQLLIVTIVLVLIAVLALSVRLIFTKKGEFHGGSCSSSTKQLHDLGLGCGCGTESCETK